MAFALNNCNTIFSQSRLVIAPLNFPFSSSKLHKFIHEFKHHIGGAITSQFTDCGRINRLVLTVSANASAAAANTASPDVQPQQNNTPTTSWAEFANNISGEWDGFGADFSKDGTPIELPESVVPEAYREWEVKVFDWQTQCPTLAQPTDHGQLIYKVIKLLPTVGCEADAATRHSVEERSISGAAAFAYRSDGCYVAVWSVAEDGRLMELEHCLVDPRDRESRVRIIQILRIDDDVDDDKGKLELRKIKVFCEQWYGPFRNGDQLGGCAIRDSAFASTEALESSEVSGVWQGLNAIAGFRQDSQDKNMSSATAWEFVDECVRKSFRDGNRLVLLPKQLWCSVDDEAEDKHDAGNTNTVCCQVGWLLDEGVAITSKCIFSAGAQLKEVAIACETAESVQ